MVLEICAKVLHFFEICKYFLFFIRELHITGLSGRPQAISLRNSLLRLVQRTRRTGEQHAKAHTKNNTVEYLLHMFICNFRREDKSTITAVTADIVSLIGIDHHTPSIGSVNTVGNHNTSGIR